MRRMTSFEDAALCGHYLQFCDRLSVFLCRVPWDRPVCPVARASPAWAGWVRRVTRYDEFFALFCRDIHRCSILFFLFILSTGLAWSGWSQRPWLGSGQRRHAAILAGHGAGTAGTGWL